MLMVAIPVQTKDLHALNAPELAREGLGYPVVLLYKGWSMSLGPRLPQGAESYGVPCVPVLWKPMEGEDPNSADVLTTLLAAWGTATAPRLVEATDWVQQTSSLPVGAGVIPASFLWPLTPNAEDIDEDQGELVIKPTKMLDV